MTSQFKQASPRLIYSSVLLVEDHDEAYHLWREAGIKNQILLHFDAHIDFEWIADKDPLKILEQKSLSAALAEFKNSYGWSFGNAVNNFTHLGNYLYRALQDGMVRQWYWIVPDSIWEHAAGRRQIWRDLLEYYQFRTGPMDFPKEAKNAFTASFFGVPFVVTSLKHLPRMEEPVLLNIDVDYLTTYFTQAVPSPKQLSRQLPWIWPDEFALKLNQLSVKSVMTTLSNSVQGGFTPLPFKFFGETLRTLLADEELSAGYGPLKEAVLLRAREKDSLSLNKLDSFKSGGVLEATRQLLRSRLLYERSEHELAKEALSEAVSCDAEFASGYNNRAKYYESLGRFKEAYEEHQMMRTLLPEQIDAKIGEADYYIRGKKLEEAHDLLRKVFLEHPDCAAAIGRLGAIHKIQSDWIKASIYFELAIKLNPKDLTSRIELGRALLKQSRYEEAKNALREALGAGAHFPASYFLLSKTYRQLGLRRKSWELWREGVRLRFKIWTRRFKK